MRFYKSNDCDDWEAPTPPDHNDGLRRLVDLLPPIQRHLIERTVFGGVFMSVAAREVGLEKRTARSLRDEALCTLRVWLETPPEGDAPKDLVKVEDVVPDRCGMLTEWGQCRQPQHQGSELCVAHLEWVEGDITPDREYERAVVEGRKEPIQARLSQSEMDAVVGGRYRGDGRRLDIYTSHDSLEGVV